MKYPKTNTHEKRRSNIVLENNIGSQLCDIHPHIETQIEKLLKKFNINKYDYKITHFVIDIIQKETLKILRNAKNIKKEINKKLKEPNFCEKTEKLNELLKSEWTEHKNDDGNMLPVNMGEVPVYNRTNQLNAIYQNEIYNGMVMNELAEVGGMNEGERAYGLGLYNDNGQVLQFIENSIPKSHGEYETGINKYMYESEKNQAYFNMGNGTANITATDVGNCTNNGIGVNMDVGNYIGNKVGSVNNPSFFNEQKENDLSSRNDKTGNEFNQVISRENNLNYAQEKKIEEPHIPDLAKEDNKTLNDGVAKKMNVAKGENENVKDTEAEETLIIDEESVNLAIKEYIIQNVYRKRAVDFLYEQSDYDENKKKKNYFVERDIKYPTTLPPYLPDDCSVNTVLPPWDLCYIGKNSEGTKLNELKGGGNASGRTGITSGNMGGEAFPKWNG